MPFRTWAFVARLLPTRHAPMNRASSTMLLVATLSVWNTVYLDKVVNTLRANGEEISDEHLAHVSPLGWQHINLLGRYEFDLNRAYPLHALRPLCKSMKCTLPVS